MDVSSISHPASASARALLGEGDLSPGVRAAKGNRAHFLYCLGLLAAIGALALSPVLISLWDVWTTDPLRSIGMLIVPVGILLTLRVWRQSGWEMSGTWWGLLPLLLALSFGQLMRRGALYFVDGSLRLNLFAPKASLFLFASGFILLFAGRRIWLRAWFPLGLLLFAQPVPSISTALLDLPLQSLSAHIARSFAVMIGFPPTNPDLLRLMFTPDFGMFIAPGCDGIRGSVTLGYVALIVGYLKRVSLPRWLCYVSSAVILGYIFNLLRLCGLVLYYRVAAGHPSLENVAKEADYVIGGCLMSIAALLFFKVVTRKSTAEALAESLPTAVDVEISDAPVWRDNGGRFAAVAIASLVLAVPGAIVIREHHKSFASAVSDGDISRVQLDDLMPKQVGEYKLNRVWQEQANGGVATETAAYVAASRDELTLGVWLPPGQHNIHDSRRTHGEDPETRANMEFVTARGQSVPFDAAYYSDGITDSFVGNALCTPSHCLEPDVHQGMHLLFTANPIDFSTRGIRAVSIFFRVEAPHANAPKAAINAELSAEAQRFLAKVDFAQISQKFQ